MKKLLLSVALVATTFTLAQKREINSAYKAAESGDFAKAQAQVSAAEAMITSSTSVDASLLEKLYYAKGVSLIKTGKVAEGAEVLAKISDLKSDKFQPSVLDKVGTLINPLLQNANKEAMDAYNAKNYAVAAPKFREVYTLLKAAGQENKLYLYYSAIAYALGKDNANSISTYKELIDSGYTGVETKYLATNKKTGGVENLDKNSWELLKKAGGGDYTDFKTEVSKSVEEELYETIVGLQYEAKDYDNAIAYADKGLAKFPKNTKLTNIKSLAYYNSGKTDQFVASLKETVAKEPNNKDAWYNLGVMLSKDPTKKEEAESYFKKAVEIDPKFANAWQNLTFLTIGDDEKTIDEYNKLRKSGKIDQANKVIEERRKRLALSLPYAEKWYESDPNNIDAVRQLRGLYSSLKNEAKAKEFKAKEEAMSK